MTSSTWPSRRRYALSSSGTASVRRRRARADLSALNVPARSAAQPAAHQRRALRSLSGKLGPRFVHCNIPARRSRRSRTASRSRVTPRWSASPTGRRPTSRAASSRSISIRTGPCRSRSCASDLIPKMQAEPDYLTKNSIRILDARQRTHAGADQLVLGGGGQLSLQAGSGRSQFARHDAHQFPSHARRLHARHAVQESVRRGCPLPFVGLRAGPECARAGRLAARRKRRTGRAPEIDQVIRSGERKDARVAKPVPLLLGLRHRLGDARRRRAVPRGHLQPRRPRGPIAASRG